ncbi:uncharacterized protein LOC110039226 [Phalaenopsis equestris]|uniref:uncharacterized protein LOC110039226 n=1 Tax=Phalaenopsis equestris TaxID=78828 RepID=UPI0009E4DBA9|nr:uncharacterized protein LOC110039226 [Phalaenopsis equestris]
MPSSFKFLVSNIQSVVNTSLSTDDYPIWKSQMSKIINAYGFVGFIERSTCKHPASSLMKPEYQPPHTAFVTDEAGISTSNPAYITWILIDQKAAAILSTISTMILPYVINLDSCYEIWNQTMTVFDTNQSALDNIAAEGKMSCSTFSRVYLHLTKLLKLPSELLLYL